MQTLSFADAKRLYPAFAHWTNSNKFWSEQPSSVVHVGGDGLLYLGYTSPGLSHIQHVLGIWDESLKWMSEGGSFDSLRAATDAARRRAEGE